MSITLPKVKMEEKPISTKQLQETKCHKCKRVFYRKLVPSKINGRELTKVNDVIYGTDGKKGGRFSILCRACLNVWFEEYSMDFCALVDKSKKQTFHHYRHLGLLKAEKELYKN